LIGWFTVMANNKRGLRPAFFIVGHYPPFILSAWDKDAAL